MDKFASPTFPLVVIGRTGKRREAELLLTEYDVDRDIHVVLDADFIVDAEGRRVVVRTPHVRLELVDDGSPIPCGFCFERAFAPPRFPPRCDVCAAENLCWSCRERRAVEGLQPAAPLPRCYECRLADADFIATSRQPQVTMRERIVAVAWGIGLGAVIVSALRACGS